MKRTQHILMAQFIVYFLAAILIAVLGETDILTNGVRAEEKSEQFAVLSVVELLVICFIPLSLRLFKFRKIARQLTSSDALLRLGSMRMAMLGVPMVACAYLYYLYMNTTFGYLAIILGLCMLFVVPTLGRCESEVSQ